MDSTGGQDLYGLGYFVDKWIASAEATVIKSKKLGVINCELRIYSGKLI